jgi:hypothetical protein
MTTEVRNLVLYTGWITNSTTATDYFNTTISNSVGTITNNRYTVTWNNINLRQLMGDTYYNSYSKFSIKFTLGITNNLTTTTLANSYKKYNDYCIDHYLSGLNFDPLQNQVLVVTGSLFTLPTSAGALVGFSALNYGNTIHNNPEYTFTKPTQDTVNITINILSTNTQQVIVPLTSAEILGHSSYTFEIKGIL